MNKGNIKKSFYDLESLTDTPKNNSFNYELTGGAKKKSSNFYELESLTDTPKNNSFNYELTGGAKKKSSNFSDLKRLTNTPKNTNSYGYEVKVNNQIVNYKNLVQLLSNDLVGGDAEEVSELELSDTLSDTDSDMKSQTDSDMKSQTDSDMKSQTDSEEKNQSESEEKNQSESEQEPSETTTEMSEQSGGSKDKKKPNSHKKLFFEDSDLKTTEDSELSSLDTDLTTFDTSDSEF
jgi:cobalamin biosynthesis protein CobT